MESQDAWQLGTHVDPRLTFSRGPIKRRTEKIVSAKILKKKKYEFIDVPLLSTLDDGAAICADCRGQLMAPPVPFGWVK
jgi:hypothetical protein